VGGRICFSGNAAGIAVSASNTCSYTLRHPLLAEKARGFIMRTSVRNVAGRAAVLCALTVLACAAPGSAMARSPLLGDGTAVRLGFGASYAAADGTTATHRGLDLAGEVGAEVVAPLAGEVTFVGRVPATGGGTVAAVTILTAQGPVTLLPLDRILVARGAAVGEGDPVATLAAGGDGSSPGSHLHVGMRTGSLYLDPTMLLTAPAVARPGGEEPVTAGETVADEVGSTGVVAGAAIAPGVTVGAGQAVSAQAGAGSPVTAPGVSGAPVTAGVGSAAADAGSAVTGAEVAPGVTLAGSGGPVAEGARATGVLADAGETIATGAKVARAASSAARDGRLGSAISRGIKTAGRGARAAALLAMGVLCAVGALWPLWRAGGMEGLGKVPVSAIGDDVAAVASR